MSTRIAPQLVCNRLVKEQWEDNEYKIHLKKVIFNNASFKLGCLNL